MNQELVEKIKRNLNVRGMIKVINIPCKAIKEKKEDVNAEARIKKQYKSRSNKKPIRVGFIAQFPEGWDRMVKIYQMMIESEDFSPYMVIVPMYDLVRDCIIDYGEERIFFENYVVDNNAIYVWDNGRCLSLENYKFDYVFYQRPYDAYLPFELKSTNVSKNSKVCYLSYCYSAFGGKHISYNKEFYRNAYFCFMESKDSADYIRRKTNKKVNHIMYVGYPALEETALCQSFKYKNVLWTPRWTYKGRVGGSNFLEYKDKILSLTSKGINLVIRPHPLAFENFIRMGYMTAKDVEDYKKRVIDAGASLDNNKSMKDTFEDTDILVTDVSSLIIRFFLTGKPIIYCDNDIVLNHEFEQMKQYMYVAHNWNEVEKNIDELIHGNDFLKEQRLDYCKTMENRHIGSSERIVNTIKEDFEKNIYEM